MPKLPEAIGKYRVIERLGRGGMGLVYKAEHPSLGTPVVIKKLMLRGDGAHRERFRREAILMMGIRHDNIVGVYDHFKTGGAGYLVMEYVDGPSLAELIAADGALTPNEAAWIIGKVALALAHIHEHGIIHRDLKPSNILLSREGKVKLGDFGIAFSPADSKALTADGTALGTPSYMAPEQMRDARRADERSDTWSLGVCFFELITARQFADGPTPAAILEALPAAIRSMQAKLPPCLPNGHRRFLKKCLRLRPQARPTAEVSAAKLMAYKFPEVPSELKSRMAKFFTAQNPSSSSDAQPASVAMNSRPERKTSSLAALFLSVVRRPLEHHDRQEGGLSAKGRSFRFSRLGLLSAVMLVLFLAGLLAANLMDRRADRFGRLRLLLVLPEQAPVSWQDGVMARIYRGSDDDLEIAADPALRLSKDGSRLMSGTVSLPAGSYRLNWSLGDRIVWKSFRLGSIRENKNHNRHPFILEESLETPPVFSLEVHKEVVDAMTLNDLDAQIVWERLDKLGGGLESGGSFRFTIKAEGYRDEVFTIAASPWRRELSLEAALWPLPGIVYIRNRTSRRVQPLLNGTRNYLNLAEVPEMDTLQRLAPGEESILMLPPGLYSLTPVGAEVRIHSNEEVHIIINSEGEFQPFSRVLEH